MAEGLGTGIPAAPVRKGDGMKDVFSVCVYCGSSSRVSDTYKDAAHQLGTLLGQKGHQLVYGGGRVGLMGIVADATLAAGGSVVGIIPEHIQVLEVEHTGLTELLVVDSMHTRKRMMVDRSDAFVVLPGGLGTLDETFDRMDETRRLFARDDVRRDLESDEEDDRDDDRQD